MVVGAYDALRGIDEEVVHEKLPPDVDVDRRESGTANHAEKNKHDSLHSSSLSSAARYLKKITVPLGGAKRNSLDESTPVEMRQRSYPPTMETTPALPVAAPRRKDRDAQSER